MLRNVIIVGLMALVSLSGCGEAVRLLTEAAGGQTFSQSSAADTCFSPCRTSARVGDEDLVCDENGLFIGCLGDTTCVEGACVPVTLVGAASADTDPTPLGRLVSRVRQQQVTAAAAASEMTGYPFCGSDLDCPDYQRCDQGWCRSECWSDDECNDGGQCYRYVCRMPCQANMTSCGADSFCELFDGESGVCMPRITSDAAAASAAVPTLELDTESLEFTNVAVRGRVTVTNRADRTVRVHVQKRSHTELRDEGAVQELQQPLFWLWLGLREDPEHVPAPVTSVTFELRAGASVTVVVDKAANPAIDAWNGELAMFAEGGPIHRIRLSYTTRPEGRWSGGMHYFRNFPDAGLATWAANVEDDAKLGQVGNALVQVWGAFMRGDRTLDEWDAMLRAAVEGSWQWALMQSYCPEGNVACAPYDNPQGYLVFSSNLSQFPIPDGELELPFAVNLKPDVTGDGRQLVGRVDSDETMHIVGEPTARVDLEELPENCRVTAGGTQICRLTRFEIDTILGARYAALQNDGSCQLGPTDAGDSVLQQRAEPWLVPGFRPDPWDPSADTTQRFVCADPVVPFTDVQVDGAADVNQSFADANPVPDGRTRTRSIRLIDGALINGKRLIVLFEERTDALVAAGLPTVSSYGVIDLERVPGQIDPSEFEGADHAALLGDRQQPDDVLSLSCDAELLDDFGFAEFPSEAQDVDLLAQLVVDGTASGVSLPYEITAAEVHYVCHDTGLFDGGAGDAGGSPVRIACPAGSNVSWYHIPGKTQAEIAALDCQKSFSDHPNTPLIDTPAECLSYAELLVNNGQATRIRNWRCDQGVYCESDRQDLKAGRRFFADAQPSQVEPQPHLQTLVDNAFRYRTKFTTRSGRAVGFTPQICISGSDATPYCYDPEQIETAQRRVDCAMHIYGDYFGALTSGTRRKLADALRFNFAFIVQTADQFGTPLAVPIVRDGFERLNAELRVMLGDDALTRAFASRFDLAGTQLLPFEGSKLEPNGIDLTGGAGFEMYSLYQAVQYYQTALDRFFRLSATITRSLAMLNPDDRYIDQNTVESYVERIIGASAKKAQAWSEIARRYRDFNRPDLARHVLRRGYIGAYMESMAINAAIAAISATLPGKDQPQIAAAQRRASLRYQSAMRGMREVMQSVRDERTIFGFSPEYVPFPAMPDEGFDSAFEYQLSIVRDRLKIAAEKENAALASQRDFDVDAAKFQGELAQIENNYEQRLAEICGTFEAQTPVGNKVLPAIPENAQYSPDLVPFGGLICGFVGNGEIHETRLQIDDALSQMERAGDRLRDLLAEIEIEQRRVQEYCNTTAAQAQYLYEQQGKIRKLERDKAIIQATLDMVDAALDALQFQTLIAATCNTPVQCAVGALSAGAGGKLRLSLTAARVGAAAGVVATKAGLGIGVGVVEGQIRDLEDGLARWEIERQCDYAEVDSNAKVRNLLLEVKHRQRDILDAQVQLNLVTSKLNALQDEAKRLLAEREEAEALAIEAEAARNDPNVRIYKNDAVITADRTFDRALREVYKLTKIYEYYTSQSYAALGDLFLVRLVQFGQPSLESYVADLEDAFLAFGEQFGRPDLRVAVISLAEDIFQIPRADTTGVALSEAQRQHLLRERLQDPALLSPDGYVTIPFQTVVADLSPLTSGHRIVGIEAEVVGTDVGDDLGRVYVVQRGTGLITDADRDKHFYGFPARTAVINPFFNGARVYEGNLYRNARLRDRPFVNTAWDLVLNLRDERVNRDINPASINDIRLYVFYEDFTNL